MESYIENKKNLYRSIHEFLEGSDEYNDEEIRKESLAKINDSIINHPIEGDPEEMSQFLEIIKSIGEHHHRDPHFNERLSQLLIQYREQIKQTLSNSEIFHLFEDNKKIVHILFQEDIITISDEIGNDILNKIENNGNRYCHFFIPELEKFFGEEVMKFLKNELLEKDPNFFTNYEEKREKGENDSYICLLIRQDSIVEFIEYLNRYNILPSSEILPSIFETNPFLIDNKNTTLIEYSAFFGSIQIFQYLLVNKVELTPSLWLYGIHSKNAEIINILETNNVPPPKFNIEGKESSENYMRCLIESIKCHHNDIADYIENNYINQEEKDLQQNEEIISSCIKYHNYTRFQNASIIDNGFFYLKHYHYDKLFELLLKKKKESIKKKIDQYPDIRTASKNNEIEVIYHYLLQINEISEDLFRYTKITQITIPSSITSIGDWAFQICSSLTQITIPSSVISIGKKAFQMCSSLTQITIPSSVTSIGDWAFESCSSLTHVTIPSSVTSIGKLAFESCSSLTHVTIPSATSIGEYAFRGCSSLTQITIPSSLTSIGSHAFHKCSSLTHIVIPSSIRSIKKYVFYQCSSLKQVSIPSSVTSIGKYAFNGCSSLTQITISSSVTSIGKCAFNGVKSLTITGNIQLDNFFKGCSSLTQVSIPSSVTSIGKYAFSGCSSLTHVTIPSSVTSIGDSAFEECSSLTQIAIPSSLTSIGSSAFEECSSLTQITIPSSLTSIGNFAFNGCSSLTQITFEIPSSVASIEDYAFSGCSSLTQITIPSSVTSIGDSAFRECSSLTQITIPSSVIKIGNFAFEECSSLTQITISSSVTSIGNFAFNGCSSLTQITFEIPSSVTSIGNYTFSGCSSLTQIAIPSSVTSIGDSAFSGCSSLTQITIPSSVTSIGDYAFSGCSSLTQITIPSSIKNIKNIDLSQTTKVIRA